MEQTNLFISPLLKIQPTVDIMVKLHLLKLPTLKKSKLLHFSLIKTAHNNINDPFIIIICNLGKGSLPH